MRSRAKLACVSLVGFFVLGACTFEARVGGGTSTPNNVATAAPPATATAPAPAPTPITTATTAPTTTATPPVTLPPVGRTIVSRNPLDPTKVAPPNPPPPAGFKWNVPVRNVGTLPAPVVPSQTEFGGPKADTDSLTGYVYFLPGPVQRLPDFDAMQPTYKLYTRTFAIGPAQIRGFPNPSGSGTRSTDFAIRYDGNFNVSQAGPVTLHFASEHGARVSIDGALVFDSDGVHGPEYLQKDVSWTAGVHTIRVEYFLSSTSEATLGLWVQKPNGLSQIWSPQN